MFSGFLQTFYGFITLKGIFLFPVLPFSLALKAEIPYILLIFIVMEILVKKREVKTFPLGMQKKRTTYRRLSLNLTEVKKKLSDFSGLQRIAHSIIMAAGINQPQVMPVR